MVSFATVIVLTFLATSFAENKKCDRNNIKFGCYKRNPNALPDLLATNRDKSSDKFIGKLLNWKQYNNSLNDLTCACSEIAESSGYEIFAVGYYGECFGGKDLSKFNPGSNTANDCINGQYQKCSMLDESDCSGVEWSEFVFGFPEDAPEKPIDGGLSQWSEYSSCSTTCGLGTKERERQCNNPAPSAGGKDCSELGALSDITECNIAECPVHGGFGEWSEYSKCSASCGNGTKQRTRSCTNPKPSNGGDDCEGTDIEEVVCIDTPCPVDGGFGEWSDYSACDKSCGGGLKVRTRTCTNPSPMHGGADCVGDKEESLQCNTKPCLGAFSCSWEHTPFNEDGGALNPMRAVFLDRHHIQCPAGKVLHSFQLERNGEGNKYRYRYECCTSQLPCTNQAKENQFTIDGAAEGDPIYLDRQNVQCNDQFLSAFNLERKVGGGEWKYKYQCCQMNFAKQCIDKHTQFQTEGLKETVYLDRHFVECPMYYGITQFILRRDTSNPSNHKYRYNYRCCKAMQP